MSNRKSFWFVSFLYLISPAEFCGLALVDTWRFSKSRWSLDRQVTSVSSWDSFTLTIPSLMVIGIVILEMHLFANITWSNDRWVPWLDGSGQLDLSHTLLKLVAIILAKVEVKLFLHIIWSHHQWVTWLGGWDTLTLNHKDYSKSNRTQ